MNFGSSEQVLLAILFLFFLFSFRFFIKTQNTQIHPSTKPCSNHSWFSTLILSLWSIHCWKAHVINFQWPNLYSASFTWDKSQSTLLLGPSGRISSFQSPILVSQLPFSSMNWVLMLKSATFSTWRIKQSDIPTVALGRNYHHRNGR